MKNSLAALFTPAMPPFYRLFMSGIVPSVEGGDPVWLANTAARVIDIVPDTILPAGKII